MMNHLELRRKLKDGRMPFKRFIFDLIEDLLEKIVDKILEEIKEHFPSLPPEPTVEASEALCEADPDSPDTPASLNQHRGTAYDWEMHEFDTFSDCNQFCLDLSQDMIPFSGPTTVKQGDDPPKYQVFVRKQ